jgi:anti-sigma factor RsiW
MTDRKPSWHDLNAYADGELAASEAAAVARAVAHDPALADQVATLARLKATVHEQGEVPLPEDITRLHRNAARPGGAAGRTGRRTWAVLGAAAAALAAVLVVGAALFPIGPENGQPSWQDLALSLHRTWAASPPPEQAAEPTADTLLASLSHLGQAAQVPDLSGARLTVGYLRPIASPYGRGLQVGYRGTRGCRVSLIILPATAGLAEKPVAFGSGGETYAWRVGGLGYALLASGMDPHHYEVVLQAVYQASRTFAPVGPETRTALMRSREQSRPCAT